MEGSFGWPWIADLLHELGLEPHLGHPPAIKVLAKNEAKADRVDADRLGRFWLRGIFPESYLSTPEVRQLRERLRYRMALVRVRTQSRIAIQAILHRQGVLHDFSDLFGKGGRAVSEDADLARAATATCSTAGWSTSTCRSSLAEVEAWMQQNLDEDEIVRWLQTIPGIGLILAHVIRAEIGELDAFPNRRKLTSYSGLAPLANDSADRHGRRHIAAPATTRCAGPSSRPRASPSAARTVRAPQQAASPAHLRRPRQQVRSQSRRGPRAVLNLCT